jgi:phytoene dehydrogenase-like protein
MAVRNEANPVLVVGAGLAGLACALHLARRGVAARVLEAADHVGGVLRTDRVEGFRLDHGFQVYPTAYPEARALLDQASLGLGSFRPGARVWSAGRWRRVGDPFRAPWDVAATLASGLITPGDVWRVLRLRSDVRRGTLDALLRRPATSTAAWLEQRGFSRRFVHGFLHPFFRGIFLEAGLATTSRRAEFSFRTFANGPATLPANGMAAIPEQLARHLPTSTITLESPVASVDDGGVVLTSGERVPGRCVVVATDPGTAAQLLPEVAEPRWNATTCLYFSAPEPPVRGPDLFLNAEGGRISHLCFPSEVQPELAPRGRTLVSVSVLGTPDGPADSFVPAVREELRAWWGPRVDSWDLLREIRLPEATPRQLPEDTQPMTRPVALGGRRFVCGAHRETASIGGALRSGRRAALAVRRLLDAA